MHASICRALWLLIWCSFAAPVDAATYFVSAAGNDDAPGTSQQQAWRTLARTFEQKFAAGDSLLLRAGDTFDGGILIEGEGDNAQKPITISSYGEGRATIQSPGSGITVRNRGGVQVENLILRGRGNVSRVTAGVHVVNTLPGSKKLKRIRLLNLDVAGFGKAGIFVEGAATDGSRSGFEDVLIQGCLAHRNTLCGIEVSGVYESFDSGLCHRQVNVINCKAHHNEGDPSLRVHSGSGILVSDVDGATIDNCEAHENGGQCRARVGGPVGIWAAVANRVTIRKCKSHHNQTQGLDGGGFDFDVGVTDSIMEDCVSHDNAGPGYLIYTYGGAPRTVQNITIRRCSSREDGQKNEYGAFYIGHHYNEFGVRNVLVQDCRVEIAGTAARRRAAIKVFSTEFVTFQRNRIVSDGRVWLLDGTGNEGTRFENNVFKAPPEEWFAFWDGTIFRSPKEAAALLGAAQPK